MARSPPSFTDVWLGGLVSTGISPVNYSVASFTCGLSFGLLGHMRNHEGKKSSFLPSASYVILLCF